MSCLRALPAALVLLAGLPGPSRAQVPDSSQLTLDRIFATPEFEPEPVAGVRWLPGAAAYTRLEADSGSSGARALIRYDGAPGHTAVVWVDATRVRKPQVSHRPPPHPQTRLVGGDPLAGAL